MNKTTFLTAALLATPALAQNDDCSGALPLMSGAPTAFDTTNATVDAAAPAFSCASSDGLDVWFSYAVTQAVGQVEISTCGNATYDTAIEVFSGSCANSALLACNDDFINCTGNTSQVTLSGLTAGTDLLIRVAGFEDNVGAGTLTLTEIADPCGAPAGDLFEANDDCATAAGIGDGNYPGLTLTDGDLDFFSFTVPAGGTLDVTASFIHADGDLDLYLWDPAVACDSSIEGEGTQNNSLAQGWSATDDETIQYSNSTGADQALILEVRIYSQSTIANCAQAYELDVSGAGQTGPGPVGVNYCTPNPNSTGAAGAMAATGFTSVAANDLVLTASSLPASQFGIFITSTTQGFVPNAGGTSNGNLCLGGQINRFQGPGQIKNSGASGSFSLAIDLANFPSGSGFVSVMSGETRSFQAWHRETGGAGSNFTIGHEITFSN